MQALRARIDRVATSVRLLVEDEDAFGLISIRPPLGNNALLVNRFKFLTSEKKLEEFEQWLREQYDQELLDEGLIERFVREGFEKGVGRSFKDANAAGASRIPIPQSTQQFISTTLSAPETADKLRLLVSRTFGELKGLSDDSIVRLRGILADGLVSGQSPSRVARQLTAQLDVGKVRAEKIARTETIRAHAEGQLDALERMGVEEIGVEVEWRTAGDGRVCPDCASMEGKTFSVDEAHGLIPLHPNCRCAFVPKV